MTCWNCHAATEGRAFCPSCGKLQPVAPGATHFAIFGLSPDVDVDVAELESQFRERSLKLHPDRFAHADAKERRFSLEQTTALNEAMRSLRDPARRAFYLLKLEGVDLEREESAAQRQMPMAFLEEVMSLREELDDARAAKDVARAQGMGEDVERRRKAALTEAQDSLRALLRGEEREAARQKASHALGRVRYFTRFLEEVAAIEEEALA